MGALVAHLPGLAAGRPGGLPRRHAPRQAAARHNPWTTTGVPLSAVPPSPSSPSWLLPQHSGTWLLLREQLVAPLMVPIEAPLEVKPDTATGVVLMPPIEPSPSWPLELSPQHSTWLVNSVAQAEAPPPPMATTPPVRPLT